MIESVMNEQYNGWTNFETFAVNLYLTNDQGLYDAMTEMLFRGDACEDYEQAEVLKEFVEDMVCYDRDGEIVGGYLTQDLLARSLQAVNWFEIVSSIGEGLDEAAGEARGAGY